MKFNRSIAALAAVALLASLGSASAVGLFQGLPAATAVTGVECIPADTGLAQGLTPTTECLTPGQIGGLGEVNSLNQYSNIPIGSVAYGSLGTNTADVLGQLWVASITLPVDYTATGIKCLSGATSTTDNVIGAVYSNTGTFLKSSALAGVLLAGASTFQTYAFTSVLVMKAGQYFVVLQGNGTAAGAIRTIAASTYLGIAAGLIAGTFGTMPATITVPTTFTADKGPICYIY